MNGALAAGLLAAALGLALAFAGRGDRTWGLVAFAVGAAAVSRAPLPQGWREGVFVACWVSVVATALSVHLPARTRERLARPLACNAAVWAGAAIAVGAAPLDLLKAMPWVLLAMPAARLATSRGAIALKVASSWLLVVAVLAALLPFLPVTPGYLPDHLD